MLNGLYSAASAMDSASRRHEVVAQNLAYADHPGYRRRVTHEATFESVMEEADRSQVERESLGAGEPVTRVDFSPGSLQQTGRALDLAIAGDAFFVVEGPEGALYTRSGAFTLDPDGTLTTVDGLPVRGGGGPITLPPDISIEQLTITSEGQLMVGQQEIGRLETARFDEPELLTSAGVSLFAAPPDLTPLPGDSTIVQGAREGSNVSPILEMVRMIDGMRQYEAASRALQAIARAIEQTASPQRP